MNYLNLLQRSNYKSFTLKATDDSIRNGLALLQKYSEIQSLGLSINQRYGLYLEPGIFDLNTSSLVLNKRYIDIIGLDEKNKSVITSNIGVEINGTINQLVDDINILNVSVINTNRTFISPWHTLNLSNEDRAFYEQRLNLLPSAYFQNFSPGQNFGRTYIENVDFITSTEAIQPMRIAVSYNGIYKKVLAGDFSFGFKGSANGTFVDCIAGDFSFGAFGTETKGNFENCQALYWSFGSKAALVKGKFTNCVSGPNSFGTEAHTNEGLYINCRTTEE